MMFQESLHARAQEASFYYIYFISFNIYNDSIVSVKACL